MVMAVALAVPAPWGHGRRGYYDDLSGEDYGHSGGYVVRRTYAAKPGEKQWHRALSMGNTSQPSGKKDT